MPELPDLTVVADALHAALAGRPIRSADAPGPLAVRGTPAELAALVGQRVAAIRRRGKFLLIELERDEIVCNPMLTGRFQLAAPGDKLPAKTAVVLGFGPRAAGPPTRPPGRAGPGGCRPTTPARGPLSRPDPDGQDLPRPGGRRSARRRASASPSRAPTPTTRR